jgi:hypothetical protein
MMLLTSVSFAISSPGASDSLTRGNYLSSVYNFMLPFTPTPSNIVDSNTVRNAVNDVLLDVSNNYFDAVQRFDTIVTTAKTMRYALNSDCIMPVSVTYHTKADSMEKALEPITQGQIGFKRYSSSTTLQYWTTWGNYLIVDGVPNTGDTLFVYYRARANLLSTDATVSNVLSKYKMLVTMRVLINVLAGKSGNLVTQIMGAAIKEEDRKQVELMPYLVTPISIKPEVK